METAVSQIAEILGKLQSQQVTQSGDYRGIQLLPYDESNETFDNYISRLENYLDLRDLNDSTPDNDLKCVQIFLNCLGPKLYQTLACLTAPNSPKSKTFKELKKLLRDHVSPRPSEVAEQHKFATRLQREGESISSFQAELRKLAITCNFVCAHCTKSTMDMHLRTQFIRGVHDTEIREKLLQQESRATFDATVKLALSIEGAKSESREMRQSGIINYVNRVKKPESYTNYKNSKYQGNPNVAKGIICFKCGDKSHKADKCKRKNLKCGKCQMNGHVSEICMKSSNHSRNNKSFRRSASIGKQKAIYAVNKNSISGSDTEKHYINTTKIISQVNNVPISDKFVAKVKIDNRPLLMELDTGAAVSTISFEKFSKIWPGRKLEHTTLKLQTYTGEILRPKGKCRVTVAYKEGMIKSYIYILQEKVDPIFGRDWIRAMNLNIFSLSTVSMKDITESQCKSKIEQMKIEFKDIFNEKIGKIPNAKCSLRLKDDNAIPIFCRPRPVPYALKERIEMEIDRLEKEEIIEKIIYTSWGTPIVPVVKKNGQIRLCADYKATLNKVLEDDNYPIPKIEDVFTKLNGGKYFCKLDLHQAYLHMQVDDKSASMLSISTHKGNYKVKRLMFGIKVAPNTWQRFMDSILQDLHGVVCFFDDIVVQGKTYVEMLENLSCVLQRLRENDLHLNESKCEFLLSSVTYLGHIIDQNGIKPMPDKVDAIAKSHRPKNVNQLRTFLGLANYYQKFLPNLATKLKPLNELLKKGSQYNWTKECERAYQYLKEEITKTVTLASYNPQLPLHLATDASPYGLGAVLSHIMPDGTERPIGFASRSLSKTEQNYSQIDKEATAIFWGLQKFFQYCYGRKITLITDHKPLTSILHPNKDLPATSALRILNYANFLSGFDYEIKYRKTTSHGNADFLSRFPLKCEEDEVVDKYTVFQLSLIEVLPVTHQEIKKETLKDPECLQYYRALQEGNFLPNGEQPVNFSIQNGCIFRGIRVLIPAILRKRILKELHDAHIGIVKMKSLARGYVWWKGIDNDIEAICRQCESCSRIKNNPAKVQLHPWDYPKYPWQRIHIDYAGPFMETNFLIIVDAYTKWIEVIPTKDTSSKKTIHMLREIFARFGLPFTIVSDNGTQFRSTEFEDFLRTNGITHKFCAPYHPSTNGLAERYVQVVKQGLRAMMNEPGNLNLKLCRLLMQYRKTPNSTTGVSSSELMLKRNIRSRIDLVKRNIDIEIFEKYNPVKAKRVREFNIGDLVQIRFYGNKDCKWKFGRISSKKGNLHYEVLVDKKIYMRHVDQIMKTECESTNLQLPDLPLITHDTVNIEQFATSEEGQTDLNTTNNDSSFKTTLPIDEKEIQNKRPQEQPKAEGETSKAKDAPILRRSTRIRRPPERLQYASLSSTEGKVSGTYTRHLPAKQIIRNGLRSPTPVKGTEAVPGQQ